MQISATSPSPNFNSGKSYVKTSVYFLAIYANFPCKIEKFELEFVRFLGTGFMVSGQLLFPFYLNNEFENCFTLTSSKTGQRLKGKG